MHKQNIKKLVSLRRPARPILYTERLKTTKGDVRFLPFSSFLSSFNHSGFHFSTQAVGATAL